MKKAVSAIELKAIGRAHRGKSVQESLAKRILEIAKSDMSDQLKEGEIATLFAQEVNETVFEILKQRNG